MLGIQFSTAQELARRASLIVAAVLPLCMGATPQAFAQVGKYLPQPVIDHLIISTVKNRTKQEISPRNFGPFKIGVFQHASNGATGPRQCNYDNNTLRVRDGGFFTCTSFSGSQCIGHLITNSISQHSNLFIYSTAEQKLYYEASDDSDIVTLLGHYDIKSGTNTYGQKPDPIYYCGTESQLTSYIDEYFSRNVTLLDLQRRPNPFEGNPSSIVCANIEQVIATQSIPMIDQGFSSEVALTPFEQMITNDLWAYRFAAGVIRSLSRERLRVVQAIKSGDFLKACVYSAPKRY